MSYCYAKEREKLFTEDGMEHYIKVRDKARQLLKQAGAFRGTHLKMAGDSWLTQAALDYLVEKGEIVKLRDKCWGQYQVYASPQVHNR